MSTKAVTWDACRDAVWKAIKARPEPIEEVFKAAGIPVTTGYEMFNPGLRRVKFDNVLRLLAVLGHGPSWLDRFAPKSARKPAGRATVKAR